MAHDPPWRAFPADRPAPAGSRCTANGRAGRMAGPRPGRAQRMGEPGRGGVANAAGIDISNYQPAFDLAAEKGRISFAFIKATEGKTYTDPEFGANWRHAKALGIVRGAYHFGRPANGAAPDAAHFLAVVRAHGLAAGDLLA